MDTSITDNPVFWKLEVEVSHKIMDDAGVPRQEGAAPLTLSERVMFMAGMLSAAKMRPQVTIVEGVK